MFCLKNNYRRAIFVRRTTFFLFDYGGTRLIPRDSPS